MSIRVKFVLTLLLYLTLQSVFFASVITRAIYAEPLPYLTLEAVASFMAIAMVWAVIKSEPWK
jgi:hypothetical protein